MSHILIVEDEPRLREDLAAYLMLSDYTVSTAATAKALHQALARNAAPAVIVLDVGLPDGNGFELAAEIRKTHTCGILMLTALGGSDNRIRGYDSGADLYLVKSSTLREIEAAIRSLLRRTADQGEPAHEDAWRLDSTSWLLTAPNQRSLRLTATEFAFLHTLYQHHGQTCSREDLVTTIARPGTTFDNRHLDAIVSRLRRKLETATQLEAPIKVVYGVGYTFAGTAVLR